MSEEAQMFIDDAVELLDGADRDALAVDAACQAGQSLPQAEIHALFRAVHTLKGNAGILGLQGIVRVAHALEAGLERVRDGSAELDAPAINTLFAGLDALRTQIVAFSRQSPDGLDVDEVVAQLTRGLALGAIQEDGEAPALAFPGWQTVPQTEAAALARAHHQGALHLYQLVASLDGAHAEAPWADARLEKLGALGHFLAWRPAGEAWEFVYGSQGQSELLGRFLPSEVQSFGPWVAEEEPVASPHPAAVAESSPRGDKAPERGAEGADATIRVPTALLDQVMNLVGELVLTRNQILQHARAVEDQQLNAAVQRLNLITTELQEGVMRTRMQPVGQAWEKFPRLARDVAQAQGKSIQVLMEGGETELDKSLIEVVKDPLTHLVRNALDHGLERPEERILAGKEPRGSLMLSAHQDGGQIIVEVRDNGRGLDVERIRSKAVARALVSAEQAARLGDAEVMQLIFHPGFSTAEQVSDLSGRGVGMDVVKTHIERVGGSVELHSRPNQGTTVRLRIPLTLAVIPALVIHTAGERFAVPQAAILEVVRTDEAQRVEQVRQSLVFRLRDTLIPVVALGQVLGLEEAPPAEGHLVVVQAGGQVFGLLISDIADTEEIVVKPLHRLLQGVGAYSGVTIMGDGRCCLILDLAGLGRLGALDGVSQEEQQVAREAEEASLRQQNQQRLLLVRLGDRRFALPMDMVARLEELKPEDIGRMGQGLVAKYQGGLLTVVAPEATLGMPDQPSPHVVVLGEGSRRIGIRVSEIMDIVEDQLVIHPLPGSPGVLGAAILHGQTVELLDVGGLIETAYPGWLGGGGGERRKGAARVLIVEDSGFFRSVLRTSLEGAGHQVWEAHHGKQALQLLEELGAPDLIVSDVEMPELDGPGLLRALRAEGRWQHLPVIALTSLEGRDVMSGLLGQGFSAAMPKFDGPTLLRVIADVLHSKV